MTRDDLRILKLPDKSGVYYFLGAKKEILYIGKATSLKNRVRSYFVGDIEEKRSELIGKMVKEANSVDFTVTDSVLEALILEVNLIRTHKPKYNTKSKDDKSYNHLIITNEKWPRVLVVREKDLTEKYDKKVIKYNFGPFASGGLLRDALKVVRRLFKFYDTKHEIGTETSKMARGKIDFNRQIGLYPENTDHEEYKKRIRQLALFFRGKKQIIVRELKKEMMALAKLQKFEEADLVKRRIFALNHIEDTALLKKTSTDFQVEPAFRVEAYDVAHYRGKDMVGVMSVVQNGEAIKSEYRKFIIKSLTDANDPAALAEMLERRLEHTEWNLPDLIVVDGNYIQRKRVEEVVRAKKIFIPVTAVVKNKQHKASRLIGQKNLLTKYKFDILLANAEAHRFAINFYRSKSNKAFLV